MKIRNFGGQVSGSLLVIELEVVGFSCLADSTSIGCTFLRFALDLVCLCKNRYFLRDFLLTYINSALIVLCKNSIWGVAVLNWC